MGISQGSWVSNRFSAPKYITTFDGTSPQSSEKGRFAFYSWEAFYEYVLACPRRVSLDGVDGTGVYRVDPEKRKVKFDFEGASHAGYSVALFRDDYRKKENLREVYAIGIDVDRTMVQPDTLRAAVARVGWGCIWHTTASDALGEGLRSYRMFFPTENQISDVGIYAECWEDIAATLRGHGVDCDAGAKDASRFWWWPARLVEHPDAYQAEIVEGSGLYDPATHRRQGGKGVRARIPTPDNADNSGNADNADNVGGCQSTTPGVAFTFRTVLEMAQEIRRAGPGELNNVLNRVAYTCGGAYSAGRYERGLTPEQVIDTLLEAVMASPGQRDKSDGQERQKILQSWTAGALRPMHSDRVPPNPEGGGFGFGDPGSEESGVDMDLERDDKLRVRKTIDNYVKILAESGPYAGRIAHDVVQDRLVMLADGWESKLPAERTNEWKNVNDSYMRAYIQRTFKISVDITMYEDAIKIVADQRKVHPVLDYVRKIEWDGVARVDRWLTTYGGVPDGPYTRETGRLFWIQLVNRQVNPGCKADVMVIFEGRQGIGKSRAIKTLAYGLSVDKIKLKDKELETKLKGSIIGEISELEAFKGASSEELKRFASQENEMLRKVWEKRAERVYRSCVLVGTTNNIRGDYLQDETGNRRFWPVVIDRFDVDALLRDRDQLWAEAIARLDAGEQPYPLASVQELAEAEQADRQAEEPWLAPISEYLNGKDEVTLAMLMERLGILKDRWTKRDGNTLGSIMRQCGWKSFTTKRGQVPVRMYRRGSAT